MNLVTITTAQRIAAEIEQVTAETLSFVESQLKRLYALANTPGEQANILAVFGTNGIEALGAYSSFKSALDNAKPGNTAESVNTDVFQPQPDGSVIYVAPPPPPEPDPQPEPVVPIEE